MLVNELTDKIHKKPIHVLASVIPIEQCIVEDISSSSDIPKPRGEDPDNIFLIFKKAHEEPHIIICDSQKEKVKWMADIMVRSNSQLDDNK